MENVLEQMALQLFSGCTGHIYTAQNLPSNAPFPRIVVTADSAEDCGFRPARVMSIELNLTAETYRADDSEGTELNRIAEAVRNILYSPGLAQSLTAGGYRIYGTAMGQTFSGVDARTNFRTFSVTVFMEQILSDRSDVSDGSD